MATIMLLVQLALAQHFTVHFQEKEYTRIFAPAAKIHAAHDAQGQGKADDGDDDEGKICPFGKVFSQAFIMHAVLVAIPVAFAIIVAAVLRARLTPHHRLAYFSRGPPIFLS
jgi:hypothetical protein